MTFYVVSNIFCSVRIIPTWPESDKDDEIQIDHE